MGQNLHGFSMSHMFTVYSSSYITNHSTAVTQGLHIQKWGGGGGAEGEFLVATPFDTPHKISQWEEPPPKLQLKDLANKTPVPK